MRYEDFVIEIRRDGGGYLARVVRSPAGEGAAAFSIPFSPRELEDALGELGGTVRGGAEGAVAGRDLAPGRRRPPGAGLEAAGERLYGALFRGAVLSLWDQSQGRVGSAPGCGLRLQLKLDPRAGGELLALPWEYLRRAETRDYLALDRHSPVVRYLDVPRPAAAIALDGPLRVLAVAASPAGLPPLDLARERRNLETALAAKKRVALEVLERPSAAALRQKLLERPFHALHFMGHGGLDRASGEGLLYFESESGAAEAVSAQALATKLRDRRSLGLVVLNACDSARDGAGGAFAGVASALVLAGLPAVVAMQRPISDAAAIRFSDAFYPRLAAGDPIEAALTEGRQAIHSAAPSSLEWGTPVLFARQPEGAVFRRPECRGDLRRRLEATALAGLLAALGWLVVPRQPSLAAYPLEIEPVVASETNGLTAMVTTVELLADGRMRLHFELANRSDGERRFGLDYRHTYLTDERGEKYEVVGSETPIAGDRHLEGVAAGATEAHWIDFPAPLAGARRLSVHLAPHPEADVEEGSVEVALPEVPERYARKPLPDVAPGTRAVAVERPFETALGPQGVESRLGRVDLLNARRMSWSFEMLNRSAAHQLVELASDAVYLVDELGNRYRPLAGPSTSWALERGVRAVRWIDFPAPRDGARRFKVYFASGGGAAAGFEVELPPYEKRYAWSPRLEWPGEPAPETEPPPPETERPEPRKDPVRRPARASVAPPPPPAPPPRAEPFRVLANELALEVTISALEAKLTRIDRLENGRLRWHFEFQNSSGVPLAFGFDPGAIYQFSQGTQYRLLASDVAPGGGRGAGLYRTTLAPGARARHWFEFSGLKEGATRFLIYLASHDRDAYRFRPLDVDLTRMP